MGDSPLAVCPAKDEKWYTPWKDVVIFIPPDAVQEAIHNRTPDHWYSFQWGIHHIENGYGKINMDYYPVTITKLPNFSPEMTGGYRATDIDYKPIPITDPADLFRYLRVHITEFAGPDPTAFLPYSQKYQADLSKGDDAASWKSNNPVNTIISIKLASVDDGSVICTESDSRHWRFAAAYTAEDKAHAVSGNREWGFYQGMENGLATGSYVFYTRGADRMTRVVDWPMGWHVDVPFTNYSLGDVSWSAADTLWQSLQSRIVSFINSNGGEAKIGDFRSCFPGQSQYKGGRVSERVNWSEIKQVFSIPDGRAWKYSEPTWV